MLFFSLLLIGIISTNIKITIICYILCYLFAIKNSNIKDYHIIIAKFFYFLIGIFISYFLIALIKKDFYIFIENLRYSLLLTIKILLVLLGNFYSKVKIKKLPHSIDIRIKYIIKIFNETEKNIKKNLQKYSKKEIILNFNKIVTETIVEIIKPYIEISEQIR